MLIRKKDIVQVHGHNVELTFRKAASYVDNLLNKIWDVKSLPRFTSAVTEDYNWS